MSFAEPLLLLTLLVVPLFLALMLVVRRRPARYPVTFTNLDVLASVTERRRSAYHWIPLALMLLTLALAATALARPRVWTSVADAHAVVVMLVDVSGSMQATDVAPTRIVAAVNAMRTFVGRLPEHAEVGLVEFSSDPQVVAQPTPDHREVVSALGYLSPSGGTALGDGLAVAIGLVQDTLERSGVRSRGGSKVPGAIVLLSDGKQNRGTLTPLRAAARARADGIRVYTVALGTADGTVTYEGLADAVPVPPDPATMKAIAHVTGGRMFTAATAGQALSVYRDLGSVIARRPEQREVTSWFVLAAAVLLVGAVVSGRLVGPALP